MVYDSVIYLIYITSTYGMNTSVFVVTLLRSALLCIHTKNIKTSPQNRVHFFHLFIWFVYVFAVILIITISLEICFVRQICFYIFIFLLASVPLPGRGGRRSHKHIYRVWLMMAWERFNPSPGGFLGPAWLIFKPIVWLTSLATPCLSSHIWIQNGILQVFQCFVDIIFLFAKIERSPSTIA